MSITAQAGTPEEVKVACPACKEEPIRELIAPATTSYALGLDEDGEAAWEEGDSALEDAFKCPGCDFVVAKSESEALAFLTTGTLSEDTQKRAKDEGELRAAREERKDCPMLEVVLVSNHSETYHVRARNADDAVDQVFSAQPMEPVRTDDDDWDVQTVTPVPGAAA